jgi:hypothetical protein
MTHSANLKARNMNFSSQIFVKKYQGIIRQTFYDKTFFIKFKFVTKTKIKRWCFNWKFLNQNYYDAYDDKAPRALRTIAKKVL